MNKYQLEYLMAKRHLEKLEKKEKEIDRQYIQEHGIINSDGEIPRRIYCIDDESVFKEANKATAKIMEDNGLWNKIVAARSALKVSEAQLVKYALSIIPKEQSEILSEAAKINYTVQLKIIETVMKLDTTTIRL
jgi:hypothetical protein